MNSAPNGQSVAVAAPKVIDFAFSRPAPARIKNAGYLGVIRYVCEDATKRISPSEAEQYHEVGLTVTLVYEDGARDAEGGQATGEQKAQVAEQQVKGLGVPDDRPVYFAVDENVHAQLYGQALACVRSFANALGRPPAVYGPRPFLYFCAQNRVTYLWESAAASWNTGPEPNGVALRQLPSQVLVDGAACDENAVLQPDYGQWPYSVSVSKSPGTPTKGSHSATSTEEDVKIYAIDVRTDSNGNGFSATSIPWTNFIAVTHEGTRTKSHFAAGEAHAAQVDNAVAVSVTGGVRSGVAVVLVAATA